MTDSDAVGPVAKKRKLAQTLPYSTSYAHSLYLLGIQDSRMPGIIPLVPDHNEVCDLDTEVSKLVSTPSDLTSLSTFMNNWFQELKPNEASWVNFLCRYLFQPKLPTSSEVKVTMLFEFSGPFKSHDIHELVREEQAIKFPLVKRDPFRPASKTLQTLAEVDLRSRSNFVFAALTKSYFQDNIRTISEDHSISGISDNLCFCAVAIAAEVKATSSPRSLIAAKSQWSSLAYLQIMERISIRREATYVDDENICQYGYCICGLDLRVWKMGLQLNVTDRQTSEILPKYYTFPVQIVGVFQLHIQADLERSIALHKKLLRWWLGKYIPSYVKDIADNAAADPMIPENWIISWRQAVAKCGCLVNHLLAFLLTLAHRQPWREPSDRRF